MNIGENWKKTGLKKLIAWRYFKAPVL